MRGIATDVKMSAVLQPGVQLGALFAQTVLDIGLGRLVARKRKVDAMQCALFQCLLPLDLIEEVLRKMAIAEEQPVAATGTTFLPLLHERAKRRYARARSDHDDVAGTVGRDR